MTKATQGISAGPLLLAVAALATATASIGLAAGRSNSDVETGHRTVPPTETSAVAVQYRRVAGQLRTLAPAGDPSGRDVGSSSALCPRGTVAASGGYETLTGGGETFYSEALTKRVGWGVGAVNNLATPGTVQAFAYCVRSGKRARASAQRAAARRKMNALVDRYRSLRASQF